METQYLVMGAVAIVVILILFRFFLKNRKPTTQTFAKSGVDIERLLTALGGKENIKNVDSTMSKVTVELNVKNNINIDEIKALGASGIVKNQNKLSMIFGKVSETVSKEIQHKL